METTGGGCKRVVGTCTWSLKQPRACNFSPALKRPVILRPVVKGVRASAVTSSPSSSSSSRSPSSGSTPHPTLREGSIISLKDYTLPELEAWVASIDEPSKRAKHIWKHLYGDKYLWDSFALNNEDDEEGKGKGGSNRDFSKDFLGKVEGKVSLDAGLRLVHTTTASDGTKKLIFQRQQSPPPSSSSLSTAAAPVPLPVENIETVLIPVEANKLGRKPRLTVCVSSQIGCAMGCKFCFTGLMGLRSNLRAGEIVEQVMAAKRIQKGTSLPVTNIVFMGMGEPFHNMDAVLKAIDILTTPSSGYTPFSQRKITVSTVGLVPEIRRFTEETHAQLALSLHATTEESRSFIVPTNNKHSLSEIIETLEELYPKGRTEGFHGRHVLIEYVMLKGINDSMEDAKRLVKLLAAIECKVNLICFNSFEGSPFSPSDRQVVKDFRALVVQEGNIVCTVRDSRGDDEMAACGQLGFNVKKKKKNNNN